MKPAHCTYETYRGGVLMRCQLRAGHGDPRTNRPDEREHVLWAAAIGGR